MAYDTEFAAGHRIVLEGRDALTVSGVEDVDRFDECEIVMNTAEGTLVVTGEELHIDKLSVDGGELHVNGRVDAISYEDAPAARGGGLFSRILGG
ncbi:MAG: YabP/YqfC family sporulation protein [Oscillospiraceae bacterium]|nr:YabP/YqfC family sporulation protein [Oscillospiraceae bacterium]